MVTRDEHEPIVLACSCPTAPGLVVYGDRAERLALAFVDDHGPGHQLVHRSISAMGEDPAKKAARKKPAKRGKAA